MPDILLRTKKSLNNWVDINENVQFLIDYPNNEQEQKRNDLYYDLYSYLSKEIAEEDTVEKARLRILAENANKKYIRYCLKCVIKNWRTKIEDKYEEILLDQNGEKISCKIVNNELDKTLFDSLFVDDGMLAYCWQKIEPELQFTENDKKKLHG
jgi:hypothetical protein